MSNARTLTLLACCEGSIQDELRLHKALEKPVRGEWYFQSETLSILIEQVNINGLDAVISFAEEAELKKASQALDFRPSDIYFKKGCASATSRFAEAFGYSEAARKLGVSRPMLRRYVRGKSLPSPVVLTRLLRLRPSEFAKIFQLDAVIMEIEELAA